MRLPSIHPVSIRLTILVTLGATCALAMNDEKQAAAPASTSELPKGAIARLGSRNMRQIGAIGALLFTGNDTRLLSTGNEREVVSWETKTGALIAKFGVDSPSVRQLVATPDESVLFAATSDGRVFRFHRGAFDKPEQLNVKGFSPIVSPTLDRVCTIAEDSVNFNLYDIDGKFVRTIEGKGQKALEASFSSDGKLLSLSSWLVPEGESKANRVAVVRIVKVDATTDDEEVKLIRAPLKVHFKRVCFLPGDKQILCGGNDGLVRVIDLEKSVIDPTVQISNTAISTMEISGDGKFAVIGDSGGHVSLLDIDGFHLRMQFEAQYAPANSIAISKNSAMVAVGAVDSTIRVYDSTTGDRLLGPSGHEGEICAVACAADGEAVATGTVNGFVHVWNGKTYQEIRSTSVNTSSVNRLAFSPTEGLLAAVCQDGRISLYDVHTGAEVKRVIGMKVAAMDCAFSPDGALLFVAYIDNTVIAIHSHSGELAHTFEFKSKSNVFSVAVSSDGKKIAGGASSVRIWDDAGKVLLEIENCKAPVNAMAFAHDDKLLFVGLADGTIRSYDVSSGEEKHRVSIGSGRIKHIEVSADGKQLLATSDSGAAARLFDTEALAPIRSYEGHNDVVFSAAFLGADRVVTGSADTTALIWKR